MGKESSSLSIPRSRSNDGERGETARGSIGSWKSRSPEWTASTGGIRDVNHSEKPELSAAQVRRKSCTDLEWNFLGTRGARRLRSVASRHVTSPRHVVSAIPAELPRKSRCETSTGTNYWHVSLHPRGEKDGDSRWTSRIADIGFTLIYFSYILVQMAATYLREDYRFLFGGGIVSSIDNIIYFWSMIGTAALPLIIDNRFIDNRRTNVSLEFQRAE